MYGNEEENMKIRDLEEIPMEMRPPLVKWLVCLKRHAAFSQLAFHKEDYAAVVQYQAHLVEWKEANEQCAAALRHERQHLIEKSVVPTITKTRSKGRLRASPSSELHDALSDSVDSQGLPPMSPPVPTSLSSSSSSSSSTSLISSTSNNMNATTTTTTTNGMDEKELLPIHKGEPVALCGAVPLPLNFVIPAGSSVAFVAPNGAYNWILGSILRSLNDGKYLLADADPLTNQSNKKKYSVDRANLIPLPTSMPEVWGKDTVYKKGTKVLAMFQNTTTFYPATVVLPPKSSKDFMYMLEFDDDDNDEGKPVKRFVHPKYVIHFPAN